MMRSLAGPAGIVLLCLAWASGRTMSEQFGSAPIVAILGTIVAVIAWVAAGARRGTTMRLRWAVLRSWASGIAITTIVSTAIRQNTDGFALGFGAGVVIGLLAAAGAAWIGYAIRPEWFRPRPPQADARVSYPAA